MGRDVLQLSDALPRRVSLRPRRVSQSAMRVADSGFGIAAVLAHEIVVCAATGTGMPTRRSRPNTSVTPDKKIIFGFSISILL